MENNFRKRVRQRITLPPFNYMTIKKWYCVPDLAFMGKENSLGVKNKELPP
jgi:hypothetical protein